jgi:O-antigen/teichoic acid export membrane protein
VQLNRLYRYVQGDTNLKSLLRGAGLMYAAGLFSIGLTFLQQITTAGLLGAEDYGRLAIILGSNALILLFVDFRTWEISTKLFSRYQKQSDAAMIGGVISWYMLVDLVSGAIGIAINVLLADLIATTLTHSSDLTHEIRLFALIIPFRLISVGVPTVILRLYDHYGWLAAKSVIYALLRLCFMTGAALLGLGLEGVLLGAILGEVLNTAILLVLLVRLWRTQISPEDRMIRFDAPQLLFGHLRTLRDLWIGGTLKGLQLETFIPLLAVLTTPAQVGLYRVGFDIASLINRVIEPISVVIQPTIMKVYEQETRSAFVRYLKQITLILSAVILPITFGMIFLGPSVFPAMLEDFDGVAQVVSLLTVGFSLNSVLSWVRPVVVAMNIVKIHNLISLITFAYSVLGLHFFSDHGAAGGAFVMMCLLLGNLSVTALVIAFKLPQSSASPGNYYG